MKPETLSIGVNTWQELSTDWPTIEEQVEYWKQRDNDLDKTESCCQWIDDKDRQLPF